MSSATINRQHAIVLGGSLGGLLTARVLSKHFDRVTIVEKDRVYHQPQSRPGQPHTRHLHGLLATGLKILTDYFPDLPQALAANGAVLSDAMENSRWYSYGGYRQRFTSGWQGATMSRPLLEHLVRERVLALPQVKLMEATSVRQLQTNRTGKRVIGAVVQGSSHQSVTLDADLIVDVTGRNSQTPKWLEDLSYHPPVESRVTVNVSYLTRLYRRDCHHPHSRDWFLTTPAAPQEHYSAGMFPIEGDCWLVSLGSWHEDITSLDARGFLEFLRNLPSPDIYHIISQCEPLGAIIPHKFPASLRRHYERLDKFPTGYLVLGDAVCSFNPIYGQGMTVAALETVVLDRLLATNITSDRLAREFFGQIANVVDIPWQLSVGEDFRFPQTTGIKPLAIDWINRYVGLVHRATLHDAVVGAAFIEVINLMAPPWSLLHPQILWRVLTRSGWQSNI
jgi:2-polyprenyl-6-methoxyphenol hydroxylase-like FAD-dependent oxidoreductase